MKKPHVTRVNNILKRLSEIDSQSIATDNKIDYDKLESNEIFQQGIKDLQECNVTMNWLREKGFMTFWLILLPISSKYFPEDKEDRS